MIMKKLILGTLMAGCLSIGASFADDTKPAGPSDAQKAKLEELKAKLEVQRDAWKAGHDSLTAEHKAEIEKRIAEHKAAMEKRKAEMDAIRDKAKALIEEYKGKIKAASDSGKAALAKELADKLKELHASIAMDHKGKFDSDRKGRENDLDGMKGDLKKHIDEIKADIEKHKAELDAKRAEWLKNHPVDSTGHGGMTPEQQAAIKAKFEEWLKTHQGTAPTTP
ncbi:MAG: hypothetical protein JWO30_2441 [Fibrobacteres bacterium]|nr:hypothetical protein [Fibrobacterota bacterium]